MKASPGAGPNPPAAAPGVGAASAGPGRTRRFYVEAVAAGLLGGFFLGELLGVMNLPPDAGLGALPWVVGVGLVGLVLGPFLVLGVAHLLRTKPKAYRGFLWVWTLGGFVALFMMGRGLDLF